MAGECVCGAWQDDSVSVRQSQLLADALREIDRLKELCRRACDAAELYANAVIDDALLERRIERIRSALDGKAGEK